MKEIEFIAAKKLKKDFEVFGWFYNINPKLNKPEFRSVLEIHRKQNYKGPIYLNDKSPVDLIAIMMNPGGSKPRNEKDVYYLNTTKELIEFYKTKPLVSTIPDTTQYQLMRLMKHYDSINRIRVINLTDICQTDSNKVNCDISYSIFNIKREKELKILLQKDSPILLAYGANYKLIDQIKLVNNTIKNRLCFGVNGSNKFYFDHPLRRHYDNKKWVNEIINQFNQSKIFK